LTETSATNPFEESAEDYDRWYDQHTAAFAAEVAALKTCLGWAGGRGLEIGVGTGRFAAPLGVSFGIDPSSSMLQLAARRGVSTCHEEQFGTALDLEIHLNNSEAAKGFSLRGSTTVLVNGQWVPLDIATSRSRMES
jgi:ubiquinone/menaquinone biosynthesis C-methylase UbiE